MSRTDRSGDARQPGLPHGGPRRSAFSPASQLVAEERTGARHSRNHYTCAPHGTGQNQPRRMSDGWVVTTYPCATGDEPSRTARLTPPLCDPRARRRGSLFPARNWREL